MIKYHYDLEQHTDEWRAARCGLLTASEMKHIITPAKLQYAQNEKEKSHLYEILSQRISGHVEPTYQSFDMLRGLEDEVDARIAYEKNYAPVASCGFVTNDKWGFTLGFSPDGLVGDDGLIEVKSRAQKYQLETINTDAMPDEFKIQVQSALLITERPWCDFISYCGGMPMYTKRVMADSLVQAAIVAAATIFHQRLEANMAVYQSRLNSSDIRLVPTVRRPPAEEITV